MIGDHLQKLQAFASGSLALDPADVAGIVSELCLAAPDSLNDVEAALAYDILRKLYPQTEMHIRRILSERLAARRDIPRELVLLLANDRIEIARQVIAESPLLVDDDLIRLVVERSQGHRVAVADRPTVSERVTDVLVYVGDAEVLDHLVRNQGAQLSDHGLKRLVIVSRTIAALQEPLLHRREMKAELAGLMYHWVGAALQQGIRNAYGSEIADHVAGDVAAAATEALREHRAARQAEEADAASGYNAMSAMSAGLVRALRRGDLRSAEAEMSRLSRLPDGAARRILYHDNGEALAVVCKSVGIGRTLFSEIFTRLYGTPPYTAFARSREHANALAYFMRLTADQADIILDGWRAAPDGVWGDEKRSNAAWELRRRQT